jgi:hypothetical protein
MKQQTKLSQEQQQQATEHQTQQQPAALKFSNTEELLRYDAEHTPVPPAIAQRLKKSTGALPQPKAAWWKRLLGGTNL